MTQVSIWPAIGVAVYDYDGDPILPLGIEVTLSEYYTNLLRQGKILTYDPLAQLTAAAATETLNGSQLSALYCTDLSVRTGSFDRAVVVVDGYSASNDGGGGLFEWIDGHAAAANGGTIFGAGSGRWLRIYSGAIDVRWFGADNTGTLDCVPAIQAAIDLANASGGEVYLPAGSYLLQTRSVDADQHVSFLVPKDGVRVYGAGIDATKLLVAPGSKDLAGIGTGPMIFGRVGILSNAIFEDFTIDWNGNLLTSGDAARNFSGILSLEGGKNVKVRRMRFVGNPGNQCVFFPATSNAGQHSVIVEQCRFENCGSGLAGNYNVDHSSVYLNGTNNKVLNNYFTAPTQVEGAAWEMHGSYYEAAGNYVENYENPFWLQFNFESATGLNVHHNHFKNVNYGPLFGSQAGYTWGDISICDNIFEQRAAGAGVGFFEGAKQVCSNLRIERNRFVGVHNGSGMWCLQLNLTKNMVVRGNTFEKWSLRAITMGGQDIGGGIAHDELTIEDNVFIDCVETANIGTHSGIISLQTANTITSLSVCRNTFKNATSQAIVPINLATPVTVGAIRDNIVGANITGKIKNGANGTAVTINHVSAGTPAGVYAELGSRWVDTSTGVAWTKNDATNAWVSPDTTPTSYVPTFTTSGGGEDIGDGSVAGVYTLIGNIVVITIKFTPGSTTNFGSGEFRFSLPFTPQSVPLQTGSAYAYDATGTFHVLTAVIQQTIPHVDFVSNGTSTYVGAASPFTWANGDSLVFSATYAI